MAMNLKTEMLAMILAGGRGTRLFDLTKKAAKPAVYYGGKYRIIDFPLSNCANSNVGIVGVLTQYESILLGSYVSRASLWGLDGRDRGTFVLPPRETDRGFSSYAGTADAIYQNIDFMDQYNPEYVVILSGDHIYKMDYDDMLNFHKANNCDVTIAGLTVTYEEATRFGIMNTKEDNRIYEFEEKPAHPKNNQASMGIYIFTYSVLRKALIEDHAVETSSHDFGKNIIPNLLNEGKRLFAYPFAGYWKDVGTIDSLWEANMDLLDPANPLGLGDEKWKIYTEDFPELPQFITDNAEIQKALINQGCYVDGKVKGSVLFGGVKVKKGAQVIDSVIMPNVTIEEGAVVRKCIVAENLTIKAGHEIGDGKKVQLIAKKEDC